MSVKSGPLKCTGWVAMEPGKPLVKHEFTRKPLQPFDCDIDVLKVGVCHSDLHLINGDWGKLSSFPEPQVVNNKLNYEYSSQCFVFSRFCESFIKFTSFVFTNTLRLLKVLAGYTISHVIYSPIIFLTSTKIPRTSIDVELSE